MKDRNVHLSNAAFLISNVTEVNIIRLLLASSNAKAKFTTCGLFLSPWLTKKIIKNDLPKAADVLFITLDRIKTRMRVEVLSEGEDKEHVASNAFYNNIEEDNIEDCLLQQELFAWVRSSKTKSQCINITSTPAAMEYHDILQDLLSKQNKKHDMEEEGEDHQEPRQQQ